MKHGFFLFANVQLTAEWPSSPQLKHAPQLLSGGSKYLGPRRSLRRMTLSEPSSTSSVSGILTISAFSVMGSVSSSFVVVTLSVSVSEFDFLTFFFFFTTFFTTFFFTIVEATDSPATASSTAVTFEVPTSPAAAAA
uniref:Uncharacterized protein n=1 Tax=Opuntia streptacantha TaxID=393608 RepID=A0A7C9EVR1_OPUST